MSSEALTLIASLGGSSVVAAFVTYWLRQRGEDRERSAAKQALQAEIEHIEEHARGYLRLGTPRSPAWRPSMFIYPQAITKLLALGAINATTTKALLTYYNHVEAFSRALDTLEAARGTENLAVEIRRALIKATLLVTAEHIQQLLREPAMQPFYRYIIKRVRVHGVRMPVDVLRHELARIPGTPFLGN